MTVSTMPKLLSLPTTLLRESPTNPRKSFGDLTELTESVRSKGVLEPLRARPLADGAFELVFGHRRLRAALGAGLAEVPVLVQELSDAEVLEAQLVENCQREDVPPLEEAEAFQALHAKHGKAVEEIAAKTGKSAAYVLQRMKLCALHASAREALREGRMLLSVSHLIARLPESLQEKATTEVLNRHNAFTQEPLGASAARDLLTERFTLRLAGAPFDTNDAALLEAAGACTSCPKRTGNQRALFADVESPDVCTDPECFAEKKDRSWKQTVTLAKEEGHQVLSKKDAKEVFGYDGKVLHGKLVPLTAKCEQDPKGRTFQKLLGKNLPALTIARDQTGRVHKLVDREVLEKALAAAGHELRLERAAEPQESRDEERERLRREHERRAKRKALIEATVPLAVEQLVAKWEKRDPSKALWRFMAAALLATSNGAVRSRRSEQLGESVDEAPRALEKLTEAQLRALVFELALEGAFESWDGKYAQELEEVCGLMKVDLKALEVVAKGSLAVGAAVRMLDAGEAGVAPAEALA